MTTRILLVSDLHFEFHGDDGVEMIKMLSESANERHADVIVVAGDMTIASRIPRTLALWDRIVDVPVIYVTGNHEAYHASLEKVDRLFREHQERDSKVKWLNRTATQIGDTRFIGCTMWFPFPLNRSSERAAAGMNDFHTITGFRGKVDAENTACTQFLRTSMTEGDVVVTHHLPSQRSVPKAFKQSPLNQFYVCDQESLIEDAKPAAWLHGHTHDSCYYWLNKRTRVACNPYGYHGLDTNAKFDYGCVIEVA